MPRLSYDKLKQLLKGKGYTVVQEYQVDEMIRFVELLTPRHLETFMLTVPRKYQIPAQSTSIEVVYTGGYDDESEASDDASMLSPEDADKMFAEDEESGGEESEEEEEEEKKLEVIEKKVKRTGLAPKESDSMKNSAENIIDLEGDITLPTKVIKPIEQPEGKAEEVIDEEGVEEMEGEVDDGVDSEPKPIAHDLPLENIVPEMRKMVDFIPPLSKKKEPNLTLREYLGILERYLPCMDVLRYNLAIIVPEGICIINNDKSPASFTRVKENSKELSRIEPTIDLETFYPKIDDLELEVLEVLKGLHSIMHTLRGKQSKHLRQQFEQLSDLFYTTSDEANHEIDKLQKQIDQLGAFQNRAIAMARVAQEKLHELDARTHGDSPLQQLYIDIDSSVERKKLKSTVDQAETVANKVREQWIDINRNLNSLMLQADYSIVKTAQNFLQIAEVLRLWNDQLPK